MKVEILRSPVDKGKVFAFGDDEVVLIGRGADCNARLNDPESSRHHAMIFARGGRVYIEDQDSKNGTFLNGRTVLKSALANDDQILVGGTLLAVRDLPLTAGPGSTVIHDKDHASQVVVTLQHDEADILAGRTVVASADEIRHENETLRKICRISQLVAGKQDVLSTLTAILDEMQAVLSADTACVLTWSEEQRNWVVAAASSTAAREGVKVSRTIIREALDEGVAILSTDPTADDRFDPSQSIVSEGISTALCSPFKVGDEFGGVLFLDRRKKREAFVPMDLRFTASVANILGLLLEKARFEEDSRKRARLAVIGEVVAGLAHYIKNVVTGFRITIVALDTALKQNRRDYTDKCVKSLADQERRISNLMMNMLSYAKERKPEKIKLVLRNLVDDVVSPYRESLDEKKIAFEFACEPEDLEIYGEDLALHRVFLNLFINSIDSVAAREDGDGGIIKIAAAASEPGTVEIRFYDNGTGIPQEKLEKIFAAFYSTKGSGGTGLGLAVVRKIIEEHGGEISVASEENKWTEFRIALPAA